MKPVVLIILDGWGYKEQIRGNAILQAKTPNIDTLGKNFPSGLLQASGISVGLPWEEPGNSEVGHISLGTGQIQYQPAVRISHCIENGSFYENKEFKKAVEHTRRFSSSLHIMGLLGSGSVHSRTEHLNSLVEFVKKEKVERVFLHLFLDGRDSPPKEGVELIKRLQKDISKNIHIKLSTLIGRKYAMDRNNNWERIDRAWKLLVKGEGYLVKDPVSALENKYREGVTDQFMEPVIIKNPGEEPGLIKENDSVIFFNFREDRAREITRAFTEPEKTELKLPKINNLYFVSMVEYEKETVANIAFPPKKIKNSLSELISRAKKTQLKIAETEKYAHVTYFFNGGRELEVKGEKRKLIPSNSDHFFSEKPEMRALEISEELCRAIKSNRFDFILANFANADMIGHTGDMSSAIKGVEVVDTAVGKVLEALLETDGVAIVTADHGNAEEMMEVNSGDKLTEHSKNPVPFYIVGNKFKLEREAQLNTEVVGILPDVTATILEFLEIKIPSDMEGESLVSNF